MRAPLLLGLVLWGMGLISARATEGTFSEDGKTLWMLSRWANSVLRFKNGEAAPTRFKIPEQILSGPYDSERIAAGPDGLLIDGGGKLWNRNPEKPKIAPKALADLPKNLTISGITRSAEAPYPGWIVLSGWYSPAANDPGTPQPINPGPLFALRPDDSSFQEISLRYKEALTATPVFAGGRMFYGWAGDLHEGTIKTNLSISGRAGDLEGFRVAPLAMIAATTRNGGHMDVREIAIAGGRIWAALGKQPAALASVPLPANPVRSDLASSLKTQQESLAGATILPLTSLVTAEDGPDTVDHLCGWTGKNGEWKIAFSLEGKTFWLLENGQEKPRQIGVELSIRGK